jgi:predicted transcriptional regulator
MRLNKHTTNTTDINKILKLLLASGYIIKNNTAIRITPLGLQALTDIERQVKEGSYKIRKSDVMTTQIKRPKTIGF